VAQPPTVACVLHSCSVQLWKGCRRGRGEICSAFVWRQHKRKSSRHAVASTADAASLVSLSVWQRFWRNRPHSNASCALEEGGAGGGGEGEGSKAQASCAVEKGGGGRARGRDHRQWSTQLRGFTGPFVMIVHVATAHDDRRPVRLTEGEHGGGRGDEETGRHVLHQGEGFTCSGSRPGHTCTHMFQSHKNLGGGSPTRAQHTTPGGVTYLQAAFVTELHDKPGLALGHLGQQI
jgi:hypothetical protein